MVTICQCCGPMNTLWFRNQLKDKHLSQRGLAKLLDVDSAAVSLMLRGRRRMTMSEAHRISNILALPVTEIMREAGIEVTDDVRRVPVAAFCDAHSTVQSLAKNTHDTVIGPPDVPADAYAVQVRASGSPQDGWLLYVSNAQHPPSERIDTLCVCALSDGGMVLAYVRRGYRRGAFNLIMLTDGRMQQDCSVTWASPVLWIKP